MAIVGEPYYPVRATITWRPPRLFFACESDPILAVCILDFNPPCFFTFSLASIGTLETVLLRAVGSNRGGRKIVLRYVLQGPQDELSKATMAGSCARLADPRGSALPMQYLMQVFLGSFKV